MSYLLYMFDLDGTLIDPYMERPDNTYNIIDWLPGRLGRLWSLYQEGSRLAVVTNQGGVAFGYQSLRTTKRKMRRVLSSLPPNTELHFCCGHPESKKKKWRQASLKRKPSPWMLRYAMNLAFVDNDEAVMIGDSKTDEDAAENAGVAFIYAEDFFGTDDRS